MNWFERYGIVGMFFIVMTGMWFFCLFPEAHALFNNAKPELLKYIGGFCGLSFLPFGYIIMTFSQLYYYSINRRRRINCRYWKDLSPDIIDAILNEDSEKGLRKLSEKDLNNEAKIEAILTYYGRKHFPYFEADKFISSFASKRYDVVAINNGLIWALFCSLIITESMAAFILGVTIKRNTFSTNWFVVLLALLIVIILYLSERIMEGQIFEVGRRKFRDRKQKGTLLTVCQGKRRYSCW